MNEGPAIAVAFTQACKRAGFRVINDPTTADIIFAHSGGCMLIPPDNSAQTVVLVGIPYWPGRSLLISTITKIRRDFASHIQRHARRAFLMKCIYHVRYSMQLYREWLMFTQLPLDRPWNNRQRQIIVRNRFDMYCVPSVFDAPFNGPRVFISLPGEHDDCWSNPHRYIELLQSKA